MKLFGLIALVAGIGAVDVAQAQTVITSTYTTSAVCGTSHSGPPIILCAQGSYVLGGNISPASPDVIDITGNNITLDLNGFAVNGGAADCPSTTSPPGNSCSGTGSGYAINVTGQNVTIKNGVVRNSPGTGIQGGKNLTVKDVIVHDNHGSGIAAGDAAHLINVTSSNNAGDGIYMSSGIAINSTSYNNNGNGFDGTSIGSQVIGSVATFNAGAGFAIWGNALDDLAVSNGTQGYFVTNGQVVNSTASGNLGDGVAFQTGSGGGAVNVLSNNNGAKGFNLTTASCYANIATSSNTGSGVSGGAAYGSTSICAH